MSQPIPAEPVLFVGALFGFLACWILFHERREKIKDDAIREYIANQKGRILPPRGGSGTAPPSEARR